MVQRAQAVVTRQGLSNVEHQLASAQALPFEAATFDAVRCERLLQHLSDWSTPLAEMLRVTKPGGRVVLMDTDHSTLSLGMQTRDLELRFRIARAEAMAVSSTDYAELKWMAALDELQRTWIENGTFTAAEVTRYLGELESAHEAAASLDR